MSKKNGFADTISGMTPEAAAKEYSRLLASRNSLKEHNDRLSAYANRVNSAVTALASEASLAFQAMAEKAGVRGHPSVSRAVQLFDGMMHQQWSRDDIDREWPNDWDLDPVDNDWSGDADMLLNQPIADAIELLDNLWTINGIKKPMIERARDVAARLHGAVEETRRQVKASSGHCRSEEHDAAGCRSPAGDLGWDLLNIAQDMSFANEMLRRDLRASAYRQICSDLYRLAFAEPTPGADEPRGIDVKVFGEMAPF